MNGHNTNMWNIRNCKTFICIGIPKHWRLFWFRYETFINFFWLLVFSTRGQRDTFFTMVTVPSDPSTRSASHNPNWTGLAQLQKTSRFVQCQISTLCFFSKSPRIPAHRFRAWRNSHTSPIFYLGFYYHIFDCYILCARAWTPALNVYTCTCTKPNSSKPNKTEWWVITNEKW